MLRPNDDQCSGPSSTCPPLGGNWRSTMLSFRIPDTPRKPNSKLWWSGCSMWPNIVSRVCAIRSLRTASGKSSEFRPRSSRSSFATGHGKSTLSIASVVHNSRSSQSAVLRRCALESSPREGVSQCRPKDQMDRRTRRADRCIPLEGQSRRDEDTHVFRTMMEFMHSNLRTPVQIITGCAAFKPRPCNSAAEPT